MTKSYWTDVGYHVLLFNFFHGDNSMHYPFHPTVTPGAPRPDLVGIILRHIEAGRLARVGLAHWNTATVMRQALRRETQPENFYEQGTEVATWRGSVQRIESADCAASILRNHRRMAHRAWVRAFDGDDEAAARRAWWCARRYCGLPT